MGGGDYIERRGRIGRPMSIGNITHRKQTTAKAASGIVRWMLLLTVCGVRPDTGGQKRERRQSTSTDATTTAVRGTTCLLAQLASRAYGDGACLVGEMFGNRRLVAAFTFVGSVVWVGGRRGQSGNENFHPGLLQQCCVAHKHVDHAKQRCKLQPALAVGGFCSAKKRKGSGSQSGAAATCSLQSRPRQATPGAPSTSATAQPALASALKCINNGREHVAHAAGSRFGLSKVGWNNPKPILLMTLFKD